MKYYTDMKNLINNNYNYFHYNWKPLYRQMVSSLFLLLEEETIVIAGGGLIREIKLRLCCSLELNSLRTIYYIQIQKLNYTQKHPHHSNHSI